jgi:hypothetical protein
MLSQLDLKIFGLQTMKDQYVDDADFKDAFPIVFMENHGANFTYRTGSCFALTSCVFQLARFVFCYYRMCMEAVSWDNLASTRRMGCWLPISFGPICVLMFSASLRTALLVRKLSHS